MSETTLADVARDYVREHRTERQTCQLSSDEKVALTVIQNRWASRCGQRPLTIFDAPETVVRDIETTRRGHELFDRTKESDGIVCYGLRKKS